MFTVRMASFERLSIDKLSIEWKLDIAKGPSQNERLSVIMAYGFPFSLPGG
jgi:hypothetical protein